jgi:outer membrane protein TolC
MKKTALVLSCATLAATLGAQTPPHPQLLRLTLKQAVQIATSPEGSVRVVFALEALRQARSRSAQSFSAFLPDIESSVSQRNNNVNLASTGFTTIKLPAGFAFPSIVGPFDVFDARATATQSIFAFSDILRYQASKATVRAAEADQAATNDDVSTQVARAYLAAQRAEAALAAADADVALAQQLLKEAQDEKGAGSGTGIEVTRARVQLLNQTQLQLIARNDRHRSHLQLLRAMNVPLDVPVELEGPLRYQAEAKPEFADARKTALEHRSDYKAQLHREETARLSNSSVTYERLPSVAGFADYGGIGSSINHAFPTRTYGIQVKVPVFDGGRRDERRVETQSQLRQTAATTQDLRQQIELDIRLAMDSLESAAEQVKVAEEALGLAESELAQARRRNAAGVSNGIEVTDAQTRLTRARDNQIAALYGYNLARVDLAQATGTIRQFVQ